MKKQLIVFFSILLLVLAIVIPLAYRVGKSSRRKKLEVTEKTIRSMESSVIEKDETIKELSSNLETAEKAMRDMEGLTNRAITAAEKSQAQLKTTEKITKDMEDLVERSVSVAEELSFQIKELKEERWTAALLGESEFFLKTRRDHFFSLYDSVENNFQVMEIGGGEGLYRNEPLTWYAYSDVGGKIHFEFSLKILEEDWEVIQREKDSMDQPWSVYYLEERGVGIATSNEWIFSETSQPEKQFLDIVVRLDTMEFFNLLEE